MKTLNRILIGLALAQSINGLVLACLLSPLALPVSASAAVLWLMCD